MYLMRLEMRGFKSFVEAQVSFQPGITAVVGPNGVGKSNILDAGLWVLGEQSTKVLRSERMEDVIFNGTETRQPLGMTEVSLILGDVDGTSHGNGNGDGEAAPLPFALGECQEVMVTRRLFRDGVSEYFINKAPCRLKDIRSLLLDTRAGSKGHTAIEQGRIDRVLKASPVERRELIEETAGIIRYKKQKAEALRKLEATSQNLVRVRDIINEVRRQLAGEVRRGGSEVGAARGHVRVAARACVPARRAARPRASRYRAPQARAAGVDRSPRPTQRPPRAVDQGTHSPVRCRRGVRGGAGRSRAAPSQQPGRARCRAEGRHGSGDLRH